MDVGVQGWIDEARLDMKRAKLLSKAKDYSGSAFHSQQAAEKALKAVMIGIKKPLIYTHDVERLAKELHAPKDIVLAGRFVTSAYTVTRYPGSVVGTSSRLTRDRAIQHINRAKEVIKWAEAELKQ